MPIYNPHYTLDEIRVYVEIINIIYNNYLEMFPNEITNHILKNKIKYINKCANCATNKNCATSLNCVSSFFILFQSNRRQVMYQYYDILHTMYLYIDVFIKTSYIRDIRDIETGQVEFDYSKLFNDYDDKLCKNTKHLFLKLRN